MNTYNVYRNGQVIATYPQNEKTFKSLKEIIARRKYAQKNARLVNLLTK